MSELATSEPPDEDTFGEERGGDSAEVSTLVPSTLVRGAPQDLHRRSAASLDAPQCSQFQASDSAAMIYYWSGNRMAHSWHSYAHFAPRTADDARRLVHA